MTIEEAKELVKVYRRLRANAGEAAQRSLELNMEADHYRARLKNAGFEYLLAPPKEGG